jgi:hypothetical protein
MYYKCELSKMHTLSPYSAEKIKVKMEQESRNNTFRVGMLAF